MRKTRNRNRVFNAGFEALESRQMMSVTVAPTGGNDTAAIQNAINSTAAGTTINLEAGTYHVSSTLNMNGHTIAGVAGQTQLDWTGGSGQFLVETGSNSAISGVTLNGAGVKLTDSSSNVSITYNTIENVNGTGIDCEGGCNGLEITHNTVQNISGYGMVLYSINNAHVDYNTITNIYEGIHAVNFLGTAAGNGCTINYNTVTGITRHGIEVQNDWNNLSIGWNYVADFNVQPGGNSHMALSIATGPGAGGANAEYVNVHDNVLLGTGPGIPSNPNYCFTAIEIMGDHSIVNHNYIANWGWSVLDGFSSNWQVTNNVCVDVTGMNGKDALPESNGQAPSADSGNTFTSGWDGTVPSSFSAGVHAASSSSVSSTQVATAVNAPVSLTATSTSSSQIDLKWQDLTTGAATYTIQIKSTYGNDPYVTVATVPAGTTSYEVKGLNANWWYNVSVVANVKGQSSSPVEVSSEVLAPSATSIAATTTSIASKAKSGATATATKTKTTTSTTAKSTSSSAATSTKPDKGEKTTKTTKVAKTKKAKTTVSSTPAVAAAAGHGLIATFYKGRTMKKAVATEVTGNVDYTFAGKSDAPMLTSPAGKTNFSVVWNGQIEVPSSGIYRFSTKASDGIRVFIDNKEVVHNWDVQGPTSAGGAIKLSSGRKYSIKVEYFQKNGTATAQLMWATKGESKEVVPDADLYRPAAA